MVKPVMEKEGWHGRSWGGLGVRPGDEKAKEAEEKFGQRAKGQPKQAPRFDGEYVDSSARPDPEDSDYSPYDDYDDEDDEESYDKGTVVGTALHGIKLGVGGGYEDMEMDDDGVCTDRLHFQRKCRY